MILRSYFFSTGWVYSVVLFAGTVVLGFRPVSKSWAFGPIEFGESLQSSHQVALTAGLAAAVAACWLSAWAPPRTRRSTWLRAGATGLVFLLAWSCAVVPGVMLGRGLDRALGSTVLFLSGLGVVAAMVFPGQASSWVFPGGFHICALLLHSSTHRGDLSSIILGWQYAAWWESVGLGVVALAMVLVIWDPLQRALRNAI